MALFKALFSFKRQEIQRAFERATFRAKIPGLTLLQATSDQDLSHGKLLIVIPGRSANAVKRNRFRRQVKAIFYEEKLYTNPIISILLVYKQALDLSFDQIKNFLIKNI